MTESEWLACEDPEELFKLVTRTRRTSQRVFRLFTAAFWRWQQARLKPPDRGTLEERVPKLERWAETGKPPKGVLPNTGPTISFFEPRARKAAQNAVNLGREWDEAPVREILCDLIREVFGNPFRKVKLDPKWLTSDVVALAKGIYAEKAFDRMPILADALQDAGCDSDEMLKHCRNDSLLPRERKKGAVPAISHVRGCWVLDLLLEKR